MQIQSDALSFLFQSQPSLTAEQKTALNDVIAKYDASDLSDDDAKALVEEISELGVSKGDDLTAALTDAGIDPKALAEQAGIGRGEGPPPPPATALGGSKGPESEEVKTLLSIVESLRESTEENGTEEFFGSLLAEALQEAGIDTSSPIVDFRA